MHFTCRPTKKQNTIRLFYDDTFTLLGGHASTLVPGKVDAVVLVAFLQRFLFAVNIPGPAVLLAVHDRFLFGVELKGHVGQRISTIYKI